MSPAGPVLAKANSLMFFCSFNSETLINPSIKSLHNLLVTLDAHNIFAELPAVVHYNWT